MNWKTTLAAVLLLASAQTTGVLAGVEPSPFQPEINQLGAVANILSSADFRVEKNMIHPPEPCVPPEPCKGLNGDVNRLEAIESQLGAADDMVFSMIREVMGVEPSPFRELLIPPMEEVLFTAEGIVIKIDEFSVVPVAPEFLEALGRVSDSALLLIGTVEDGIEQLSGGTMACVEITDEETCNSTAGCAWLPDEFCDVAGS